jgi:hypothetical protein
MGAVFKLHAEIGVVASELLVVPTFPDLVARNRPSLGARLVAPCPAVRKRFGAPRRI